MPEEDRGQKIKNIEARTMASDQESIKEQGGGAPQPYKPEMNKNFEQENSSPETRKNNNIPPIPNDSTEEEVVYPPQQDQGGGQPPQDTGPKQVSGEKRKPKKQTSSGKTPFIIILIVIVVAGLGVGAYYMLMGTDKGPDNTQNDNQGVSTTTEPDDNLPDIPVFEPTSTVPSEPATSTESGGNQEVSDEIPVSNHISLFSNSPDSSVKVELGGSNISFLRDALKISSTEVPFYYQYHIPLLREVVLHDDGENLVKFSELANILAPSVLSNASESFNDDATLFTYSNQDGTWFGIVGKLKSDADKEKVKTKIAQFDSYTDEVKNFFLEKPGKAGDWQDGNVKGQPARFVPFGRQGAAFSFTWLDDKLLISTNYEGALEAAKLLGF